MIPAFVTENWIFLQQHLWPSTLMFVIFLASLVVLAFDKRGSARRLFWYSVILLAGVIYNPYFWYALINSVYEDDNLVQLRLPWLVPAFLIMAYAMCRIAFLVKRWQISALIIVAFVVLIWWAGVPFHPNIVVRKQNIYKISEEAKESADAVLGDMKAEPEHPKERPKLIEFNTTDYSEDISAANAYHYGIRQYTSAITAYPVWVTEEEYSAEGFSVTDYYHEPCRYLAYEVQAEQVGESAERVGYSEIARTDAHAILRYHRDAEIYLVIRGETTADAAGELPGGGEVSLTDKGQQQAQELGEKLSEVHFSAAYAGENAPAAETADVILQRNRSSDGTPEITSLSSLNEVVWGLCDGWKIDDVTAQYGEEVLSGGDAEDSQYVSPIGAQSRYSVVQRLDEGMGDTVKNLEEDGQNILVVANPSAIWWLEQCAAGGEETGELKPGDCVKLRFEDGEWIAEKLS